MIFIISSSWSFLHADRPPRRVPFGLRLFQFADLDLRGEQRGSAAERSPSTSARSASSSACADAVARVHSVAMRDPGPKRYGSVQTHLCAFTRLKREVGQLVGRRWPVHKQVTRASNLDGMLALLINVPEEPV
jgi:hypothetical protein